MRREVNQARAGEQMMLKEKVFEGSRGVSQTFDRSKIRYFSLPEFRQVAERCAVYRVRIFGIEVVTASGRLVDVCLPPDEGKSIAWCLAYLERFRGGPTLLFTATYERRGDHGVSRTELL